jgi:F-box domain
MSLDGMPTLVLFTIASFLDIGHVLSLSQVNKNMRNIFISNHRFWSSGVRDRLRLTGVPQHGRDYFKIVVDATKTKTLLPLFEDGAPTETVCRSLFWENAL